MTAREKAIERCPRCDSRGYYMEWDQDVGRDVMVPCPDCPELTESGVIGMDGFEYHWLPGQGWCPGHPVEIPDCRKAVGQ